MENGRNLDSQSPAIISVAFIKNCNLSLMTSFMNMAWTNLLVKSHMLLAFLTLFLSSHSEIKQGRPSCRIANQTEYNIRKCTYLFKTEGVEMNEADSKTEHEKKQ